MNPRITIDAQLAGELARFLADLHEGREHVVWENDPDTTRELRTQIADLATRLRADFVWMDDPKEVRH